MLLMNPGSQPRVQGQIKGNEKEETILPKFRFLLLMWHKLGYFLEFLKKLAPFIKNKKKKIKSRFLLKKLSTGQIQN